VLLVAAQADTKSVIPQALRDVVDKVTLTVVIRPASPDQSVQLSLLLSTDCAQDNREFEKRLKEYQAKREQLEKAITER
jgi:hypothetical protein